jgi:hypothetical protein
MTFTMIVKAEKKTNGLQGLTTENRRPLYDDYRLHFLKEKDNSGKGTTPLSTVKANV